MKPTQSLKIFCFFYLLFVSFFAKAQTEVEIKKIIAQYDTLALENLYNEFRTMENNNFSRLDNYLKSNSQKLYEIEQKNKVIRSKPQATPEHPITVIETPEPDKEVVVDIIPINDNESNEITEIEVFPNPAKDKLSLSSIDSISKIEIYDMSGKQIYVSKSVDSIDISSYKSGVYIIKVFTDLGVQKNIKFIKE